VLVDCLSSITGPQQVTNDNGAVTKASIVLAPCAAAASAPIPVDSTWMLCLLGFALAATAVRRLSTYR
jgi:hypothetical protein